MELQENAKENIWMETIRTMTEKEITYKDSIHRKIKGIRLRQMICITISSCALLTISVILYLVMKNLNDMNDLIKALTAGFQTIQ